MHFFETRSPTSSCLDCRGTTYHLFQVTLMQHWSLANSLFSNFAQIYHTEIPLNIICEQENQFMQSWTKLDVPSLYKDSFFSFIKSTLKTEKFPCTGSTANALNFIYEGRILFWSSLICNIWFTISTFGSWHQVYCGRDSIALPAVHGVHGEPFFLLSGCGCFLDPNRISA